MVKNLYNVILFEDKKKVTYKVVGCDVNDALWNLKSVKRPYPNESYDYPQNKDWFNKVDHAVCVELVYDDIIA